MHTLIKARDTYGSSVKKADVGVICYCTNSVSQMTISNSSIFLDLDLFLLQIVNGLSCISIFVCLFDGEINLKIE